MTNNQIFGVMQKALKIRENLELTDDMRPGDIKEWDSMGHMLFIMELEKEFQVNFEYDDILEMDTIGKIRNILEMKYSR